MTSDDVIRVANLVLEWTQGPEFTFIPLTAKEEQEILDMYYSKYGIYEQDWQEIAESIR